MFFSKSRVNEQEVHDIISNNINRVNVPLTEKEFEELTKDIDVLLDAKWVSKYPALNKDLIQTLSVLSGLETESVVIREKRHCVDCKHCSATVPHVSQAKLDELNCEHPDNSMTDFVTGGIKGYVYDVTEMRYNHCVGFLFEAKE